MTPYIVLNIIDILMNAITNTVHQSALQKSDGAKDTQHEKIIVIGAGPVGIRFAQEILKRRPKSVVHVFSNEAYQPYNRVQLSSLLNGEIDFENIITPLPNSHSHPHFEHIISTIKSIDTAQKVVITHDGEPHVYDKLVIATGSRPHIPDIPGIYSTGVYTLRTLKDTEFLYSRVTRARHIVVVGGGLLGIEASRALLRSNTKVTLIQHASHLMNRQLDKKAAALLTQKLEAMGVEIITGSGVREVIVDERVTGIITRDKQTIDCDTVLFCAGIKPNMELARAAKIKTARGIVVDDQLRTSVPDVYAIGECCEHRGLSYGLVNPGFEQAAIAADHLCGGHSNYIGSLEVSRLKVVGEDVCSMGKVNNITDSTYLRKTRYFDKEKNTYRKIITYKRKIIGAVGFGQWDESRRIQEAFQNERTLWPWQLIRFRLKGHLFPQDSIENPRLWPQNTIICQCNNISQGSLTTAIEQGCISLTQLKENTQAGTVCGSCTPLLNSLLGQADVVEKQKAWQGILAGSLTAISVAMLIAFLPALAFSDSVQTTSFLENIWNDKYWKQVTGFTLLGMSVVGLFMSLKKRLKIKKLGEFGYWRLVHIVLGVLCAFTLILHTGMHLGENLNRALIINFLAILMLGSLAGIVGSVKHTLSASLSKKLSHFWQWMHILVSWPLPILLAFHILSTYYY